MTIFHPIDEKQVAIAIFKANNYLGGGFWIGGYLMNKLTVRAPGQEVLDEIGVPYKEVEPGLFVADGPHACSKLVAAACDAGAKVINLTPLGALPRMGPIFGGMLISGKRVAAIAIELLESVRL